MPFPRSSRYHLSVMQHHVSSTSRTTPLPWLNVLLLLLLALLVVLVRGDSDGCDTVLTQCTLYDLKYGMETHQLTCVGDMVKRWDEFSQPCDCSLLGLFCKPAGDEKCIKRRAAMVGACELASNKITDGVVMEEMYQQAIIMRQQCLPDTISNKKMGQVALKTAAGALQQMVLQTCIRVQCPKVDRHQFANCVHAAVVEQAVALSTEGPEEAVERIIQAKELQHYFDSRLGAIGLPAPSAGATPGEL